MSARDFDLLAQSGTGSADSKAALLRVANELRRRTEDSAAPSSVGFFLAALKSLTAIRGTRQAEPRLMALHDCGVFFYLNNREDDALRACSALRELATRTERDDWIRKGYQLEGVALSEAGRIADGVIAYSKALEFAGQGPEAQAKTLINLGIALNYGALYRDAIPCFELAHRKSQESPSDMGHVRCAAMSNLAQSYLYLGEFEKGYTIISDVLRSTKPSKEAFVASSLAVREYIAFRLALELGDESATREHLERCLSYGSASNTVKGRFIGQIASGLHATYAGDAAEGLVILQNALSSSSKRGSYYEEAVSSLVRAYDRLGEPELALEHMQALLRHLKELRSQVLSVQGHAAGDSDLIPFELEQSKLETKVALRAAARAQLEMLERLAVTADLKEEASGEHGYRVGRLSALIAETLGWSREQCHAIDLAARLHDIGKIAMPDRILLTSEQLKDAERQIMSTHTSVGAELLANSKLPQLQMAEEIAKFHHEWWNGEGYPAKRREKRIPLHARIVAIADVFDALTHGRPFAAPWSMDDAIAEIVKRRGTQFDPDLVDIFVTLIARLREEHSDLDGYLGKAGRNSPFLQARAKIRRMLAEPSTPPVPARKASETVH